jgi:hypothetical protein
MAGPENTVRGGGHTPSLSHNRWHDRRYFLHPGLDLNHVTSSTHRYHRYHYEVSQASYAYYWKEAATEAGT